MELKRGADAFELRPTSGFADPEAHHRSRAAPLLVIDNLVPIRTSWSNIAAGKHLRRRRKLLPRVRAKAPLTYQQFRARATARNVRRLLWLDGAAIIRFTMCHFSLVTTPADKLSHLQRIPHIDSLFGNELAFIHYLFKAGSRRDRLLSTSPDRLRSASTRRGRDEYFACVEEEKNGPNKPDAAYIDGDTRAL